MNHSTRFWRVVASLVPDSATHAPGLSSTEVELPFTVRVFGQTRISKLGTQASVLSTKNDAQPNVLRQIAARGGEHD